MKLNLHHNQYFLSICLSSFKRAISMKIVTYWLTFLAHALSNGMRVTYSFNKVFLMKTFGFSEFYLGFMDMVLMLSIGIGCVFRFNLIKGHDLKLIFLKGSMASAVGAAILPFFSFWYTSSSQQVAGNSLQQIPNEPSVLTYIVVSLSFFGVGLYKFSCFPIMATLMSEHYSSKKDGCMFGFWMSSWLWGCIACLALCNFVVIQLQCRWEVSLLIISIAYIAVGLVIYWTIQNPQEYSENKQATTTNEFFAFIREVVLRSDVRMYLFLTVLGACAYYTIIFWLPMFFHSSGYGHISGYVSTLFYLASIFGTFTFGWLYELNHQRHQKIRADNVYSDDDQRLSLEQFSLCGVGDFLLRHICEFSVFISAACCLVIVLMENNSLYVYGLLIFAIGFFLGGAYNTLRLKDLYDLFEHEIHSRELFSYFALAVGQGAVAISQLIVGAILRASNIKPIHTGMGLDESNLMSFSSRDQNGRYIELFYILIVTLTLYGLSYIARSVFVKKNDHQQSVAIPSDEPQEFPQGKKVTQQ